MSHQRYILMSFDVEEFDMPLEYNQSLSIYEQMETGFKGLQATMSVINGHAAAIFRQPIFWRSPVFETPKCR